MDTPESLTPAILQTFEDSPTFHFTDYFEPRGGWRTFNEFFTHHVKPGYRPVAAIGDPNIITSPAGFAYNGLLEVSETSTATVKGLPWRISKLLADSPFKTASRAGPGSTGS